MYDISTIPLEQFPCVSIIAYTGRQIQVAGYSLPVVVDLNSLEIPKQNIPLLLDHNLSQIVGLTMSVKIVHNTLLAVGVVDNEWPNGRDVWRSGLLGFPWRASISVRPSQLDLVENDKFADINGRPIPGPCYILRQATLQEISFVDKPADDFTAVCFHPPKVR